MGTRLDTSYLVNEFNDQIINQLGEPDPLLVDEYELFIESLEIAVDKRNNRDGLALSEFKQGFKLFADASGLFATQGRIQQDDYQQIAFESGVNLYLLGEEVNHLPQSFERENLQDRNIERWNLHIMSSMGNLDGNDISGLSFKTHFSTDPEDIDFTGATLDPYQKISLDGYTDFNDVEVIEILVSEGQILKKNDPLITIESDKSSVEIPSNLEGKIKFLKIKVGDKVSEGDLILILESKSQINEVTEKKPEIEKEFKKIKVIKPEIEQNAKIQNKSTFQDISSASPKTRKFARELGVDIRQVVGSEKDGRVIEDDIKKFVSSSPKNINEIRGKCEFVQITAGGLRESHPHDINTV